MKCIDLFLYKASEVSSHLQFKITEAIKLYQRKQSRMNLFTGKDTLDMEIDAEAFLRFKLKSQRDDLFAGAGGYCIYEIPMEASYSKSFHENMLLPFQLSSNFYHCPYDSRVPFLSHPKRPDIGSKKQRMELFDQIKQVGHLMNQLSSFGIPTFTLSDTFSCSFPLTEVEALFTSVKHNFNKRSYLLNQVESIKKISKTRGFAYFLDGFIRNAREAPEVLTFNYLVFEPITVTDSETQILSLSHKFGNYLEVFRSVLFQLFYVFESSYLHSRFHHGAFGWNYLNIADGNLSSFKHCVHWSYIRWDSSEYFINSCLTGKKPVKLIPSPFHSVVNSTHSPLSDYFTVAYHTCMLLQKAHIKPQEEKQFQDFHRFLYLFTNGEFNSKRYFAYSKTNEMFCPWTARMNPKKQKLKFSNKPVATLPLDHEFFQPLKTRRFSDIKIIMKVADFAFVKHHFY